MFLQAAYHVPPGRQETRNSLTYLSQTCRWVANTRRPPGMLICHFLSAKSISMTVSTSEVLKGSGDEAQAQHLPPVEGSRKGKVITEG